MSAIRQKTSGFIVLGFIFYGFITPVQAADWLYTARPGDTLWGICERYTNKSNCWLKLGDYAGVKLPRYIPPGSLIKIPVSWLKELPTPVSASYVTGDVVVVLADGTSRQVIKGDKFPIGSILHTNEGYVTLLFGGGAQMVLEDHSELLLDAMSTVDGQGFVDSRLRLNRGSIKARVPITRPRSRFNITTPAAVAAVRGTEFRVSYDSDGDKQSSMRGEVFEGLIAVAADAVEEDVPAGFGIVAEEGQGLTTPVQLLPPPTFTMAEYIALPVTLSWAVLEGAQSYSLEVFNDNNNEELLLASEQSELNYSIDSLLPGCYLASVRGIDSQQLHGTAAQKKFCISDYLLAPSVESFKFKVLSDENSVFNWAPVKGAAKYQIAISEDAAFVENVIVVIVSEPILTLDTADKNVLYVRVQAIGEKDERSVVSEVGQWAQTIVDKATALVVSAIILLILL